MARRRRRRSRDDDGAIKDDTFRSASCGRQHPDLPMTAHSIMPMQAQLITPIKCALRHYLSVGRLTARYWGLPIELCSLSPKYVRSAVVAMRVCLAAACSRADESPALLTQRPP